MSPPALATRLRQAAALVLVTGGICAAWIWLAAVPAPADPDFAHEADALARLGGTAGVQLVAFDQWISSLWHGRRLAGTIAVLALVAFALLRHVANLAAEDADDPPTAR